MQPLRLGGHETGCCSITVASYRVSYSLHLLFWQGCPAEAAGRYLICSTRYCYFNDRVTYQSHLSPASKLPCCLLHTQVLPGEQARHASTAILDQEDHSIPQDNKHTTQTAAVEDSTDALPSSLHHSSVAPHQGMSRAPSSTVPWLPADVQTVMKHHVYPKDYLESIKPKHLVPEKVCMLTH